MLQQYGSEPQTSLQHPGFSHPIGGQLSQHVGFTWHSNTSLISSPGQWHWELAKHARPIRPAVQTFGAVPHVPPSGHVPSEVWQVPLPTGVQTKWEVQVMKLQVCPTGHVP